jgi:hypothetical protein
MEKPSPKILVLVFLFLLVVSLLVYLLFRYYGVLSNVGSQIPDSSEVQDRKMVGDSIFAKKSVKPIMHFEEKIKDLSDNCMPYDWSDVENVEPNEAPLLIAEKYEQAATDLVEKFGLELSDEAVQTYRGTAIKRDDGMYCYFFNVVTDDEDIIYYKSHTGKYTSTRIE